MTPALPPGATLVDPQSISLPPGAKLVTTSQDQPSALHRFFGAALEGTDTLTDLIDVARGNPGAAMRTGQRLQAIGQAIQNFPANVGQSLHDAKAAYDKGDTAAAANHLAGVIPVAGPMYQRVMKDIDNDDLASALGHMIPFAAMTAGEYGPQVGAAVKTGAGYTSDVGAALASGLRRAAVKTAEKYVPGSTQILDDLAAARAARATAEAAAAQRAAGRTPLWADMPPPDVPTAAPELPPQIQAALASGRVPGSIAAQDVTPALPPQRTPLWAGMPEAAPPAVATPPAAPEALPSGRVPGGIANQQPGASAAAAEQIKLLDDVSRGLTGKPFARLDANGQATVRDIASKLGKNRAPAAQPAPAAPGPEVTPPPAAPEPATAAPAPSIEDLSRQLNESLAQGPQPAPKPEASPEPFKAKARAERAADAQKLGDYLIDKGFTSDQLKAISHREQWRALVKGTEMDVPTPKGAQAVIDYVQGRETAAPLSEAERARATAEAMRLMRERPYVYGAR